VEGQYTNNMNSLRDNLELRKSLLSKVILDGDKDANKELEELNKIPQLQEEATLLSLQVNRYKKTQYLLSSEEKVALKGNDSMNEYPRIMDKGEWRSSALVATTGLHAEEILEPGDRIGIYDSFYAIPTKLTHE
jgi:hypothetical protein